MFKLNVILILLLGDIRYDAITYYADANYLYNNCKCVPEHMCEDNAVTISGNGFLDIRYIHSPCKNYYEVCCENPIKDTTPSLFSDIHSASFKSCGYGNSDGLGYRITGDSTNAHFAELPWTIVVLYKDPRNDKNLYKCGGSLIHQQVVLTAAHCVNERSVGHWIVRAGEWNTENREEPLPHQDRIVKEFFIHPHFHPGSLKNDIALLFLSEPFELSENVRLVCLPDSRIFLDNFRCIASGWGKNAFKKGLHSAILKKIEVPLVPKDLCLKLLRETRLGKFYHLHSSFICAGGELNKDTCKGDGGSPLVCPIAGHTGRYFQAGIVSWGIGCGENKTPGVYVNVALYVEWIDKQLTARNFDINVYKYE